MDQQIGGLADRRPDWDGAKKADKALFEGLTLVFETSGVGPSMFDIGF